MAAEFVPKLAIAILILVVGFRLANRLARILEKSLTRTGASDDVKPFLKSMATIAMKVLLVFTASEIVGIKTASFMAVLAGAGFAIALALQGSLGNFAAGIILLIFRPYRLGDWIEVHGRFGKVEEIQIFNTIIITPGLKTLIVPNGKIIDDVVVNFSQKGSMRLELIVKVPYEESFPKAKKIILNALLEVQGIKKDPPVEIGIQAFDSHNITISVRPYVNPDEYWLVTFNCYEKIKQAFNLHQIKVAYPEGVELGVIGE